jgi:hypothetical protein
MDQTDGTDYIDQIDEIISCLCTNVPLDSMRYSQTKEDCPFLEVRRQETYFSVYTLKSLARHVQTISINTD